MKRIGWKFNEKALGLLLTVAGLLGLWLGWSSLAQKPATTASFVARQTESQPPGRPVEAARTSCKVLTVYDGDTLGCDLNEDGAIQKPAEQVRLLGIDSPEMRYSRKNPTYGTDHPQDESFAKEASQWLTRVAQGKTVCLAFDQRRQDKYERTLAYVFADARSTKSLNAALLTEGYATLLFIGKNRRYEAEFQSLEAQARQARKGLWR